MQQQLNAVKALRDLSLPVQTGLRSPALIWLAIVEDWLISLDLDRQIAAFYQKVGCRNYFQLWVKLRNGNEVSLMRSSDRPEDGAFCASCSAAAGSLLW